MNAFPRTGVGGVSVSRMVIGTNWFLGWSHCTRAKDSYIKEHVCDRKKIADIIEVFANAGVDTIIGFIQTDVLADAIREAEAQELVDLSLGILERRRSDVVLQETRSKAAVKRK